MFMKELAQSRMSTFSMLKDKVLFGERDRILVEDFLLTLVLLICSREF